MASCKRKCRLQNLELAVFLCEQMKQETTFFGGDLLLTEFLSLSLDFWALPGEAVESVFFPTDDRRLDGTSSSSSSVDAQLLMPHTSSSHSSILEGGEPVACGTRKLIQSVPEHCAGIELKPVRRKYPLPALGARYRESPRSAPRRLICLHKRINSAFTSRGRTQAQSTCELWNMGSTWAGPSNHRGQVSTQKCSQVRYWCER